jgi:hypothetical protein
MPSPEAHLREQDRALPRFVLREFGDYLHCGRLEHGFVRLECTGCRNELLIAFSRKRRGCRLGEVDGGIARPGRAASRLRKARREALVHRYPV